MKKFFSLGLILILLLSAETLAEHSWYDSAAEKFINLGAISIQDDMNANITRLEFASIVNVALGYLKNGCAMVEFDNSYRFNDIGADDLYRDQFLIARSMGILQGDQNNNANPFNLLTRSEVAVVIARIIGIEIKNMDIASDFYDDIDLPDWARSSILALTKSGYLKGDTANNFRPTAPITRAEFVVLLDRVLGEIIKQDSKINNKHYTGNVTIIGDNVSITNTTISGNLLITQAAKDVEMVNLTIGKDLIYK